MGLANPGAEFERTRHNAGGDVVELLARRFDRSLSHEKGQAARLCEVVIGDERVALAVPTTYMNRSGDALGALLRRVGVDDPTRVIVVHDELDLPPGKVRVKAGGGLSGHHGLESVERALRSREFLRVRVGIGRPPGQMSAADFVLRRPSGETADAIAVAFEVAADAVEGVVHRGPDVAMNEFNKKE